MRTTAAERLELKNRKHFCVECRTGKDLYDAVRLLRKAMPELKYQPDDSLGWKIDAFLREGKRRGR